MSPLLVVGLTGGIAAGKSHVLSALAASGCHTLDLDRVAHAVMAPGGSAYTEVVEAFGREVLAPSGQIDRGRLGRIVFADEAARLRLNALVHPRVYEEEQRRARELAAGPGGALVVDAALLIETGMHLRFDRLIVVDVSPEVQLRRLLERDGMGEAAARQRIDSQMPVSEKRRYAHFRLDNSGDRLASTRAAARLAAELLEQARRPVPGVELGPGRVEAALAAGPRDGRLWPGAWLEWVAAHPSGELAALSRELGLARDGAAWYEAEGADPVETLALAVPLAVWALRRRGEDRAYLGGAAFSVARLFGADTGATAALVQVALAAAEGAVRGLAAAREGREARASEVERWCGRRSPSPLPLEAALAHPTDAAAARAALGDPRQAAVAAALVALATGAGDRPSDAHVRRSAAAGAALRRPR